MAPDIKALTLLAQALVSQASNQKLSKKELATAFIASSHNKSTEGWRTYEKAGYPGLMAVPLHFSGKKDKLGMPEFTAAFIVDPNAILPEILATSWASKGKDPKALAEELLAAAARKFVAGEPNQVLLKERLGIYFAPLGHGVYRLYRSMGFPGLLEEPKAFKAKKGRRLPGVKLDPAWRPSGRASLPNSNGIVKRPDLSMSPVSPSSTQPPPPQMASAMARDYGLHEKGEVSTSKRDEEKTIASALERQQVTSSEPLIVTHILDELSGEKVPVYRLDHHTPAGLLSAVEEELRGYSELSVDSEGDMEVEGQERLDLVQILGSGDSPFLGEKKGERENTKNHYERQKKVFLFDMTAHSPQKPLRALISLLRLVLERPAVVKIFHDGRSDLSGLWNCFGIRAGPIFDTQAVHHNLQWQESILERLSSSFSSSSAPHFRDELPPSSSFRSQRGAAEHSAADEKQEDGDLEKGERRREREMQVKKVRREIAERRFLPQSRREMIGLNSLLQRYNLPSNPLKEAMHVQFEQLQDEPDKAERDREWRRLVSSRTMTMYAAHDVLHLQELKERLEMKWRELAGRWSQSYFSLYSDSLADGENATAYAAALGLPCGVPLCLSFEHQLDMASQSVVYLPRYTVLPLSSKDDGTRPVRKEGGDGLVARGSQEIVDRNEMEPERENRKEAESEDGKSLRMELQLLRDAVKIFPPALAKRLLQASEPESLEGRRVMEIVMDYGRPPFIRLSDGSSKFIESQNPPQEAIEVEGTLDRETKARRSEGLKNPQQAEEEAHCVAFDSLLRHFELFMHQEKQRRGVARYEAKLEQKPIPTHEGNPEGKERRPEEGRTENGNRFRSQLPIPLFKSLPKDHRLGIAGTLHRLSFIRGRNAEQILGLTFRLGRHIEGSTALLKDLISYLGRKERIGGSRPSLLLLGPPGVGKTTLLREITSELSSLYNKSVVVVDTSNEIAGDSDVPHSCIGRARRLQVPDPQEQHRVMLEAVKNHCPDVLVIDEIGASAEVAAAKSIANRGVSLVATAHGCNLSDLLRNPELTGLVGGLQRVILSAAEAKDQRATSKTKLERAGAPVFSILVEIWEKNHYCIHTNVARSVDALLSRTKNLARVEARYLERMASGTNTSLADTKGVMRAVLQPSLGLAQQALGEIDRLFSG